DVTTFTPFAVFPADMLVHHWLEVIWIDHDIKLLATDPNEEMIHEAIAPKHLLPDAYDEHPPEEMRQIQDTLHEALKTFADDCVEQQREYDTCRESEDNL